MADSEASSGLIQVFCQACGKRLVFSNSLVGRRARCLGCAHVFRIPEVAKTIDPNTDDPEIAGLLKEQAAKSSGAGLVGDEALHPHAAGDGPAGTDHAPLAPNPPGGPKPAEENQASPARSRNPAARNRPAHKRPPARQPGRLKQKPVDKRVRYPDVKPEEQASLVGDASGSGSAMSPALPSSSGAHDALDEEMPQAPEKSGALLVIEGILYVGCMAVVLVLLFWLVHWSIALWILLPILAVYGRSLGVRLTFLLTGGLVSPSD